MEKPNLNYINQLARDDESVKQTLIDVVKTEFPEELLSYQKSLKSGNFKNIEDNVHRIKHKFSILGLEKAYNNAVAFELSLREEIMDTEQQKSFNDTLDLITNFISTI